MFPSLNEGEQQELERSINKIGLQEAITLYEGKILDGVHRNNACLKVGVEPKYENLQDGISAEDFVLAKNVHRRHLNSAQKVEIALKFREKKGEKLNNEKILIEKLEKINKNDVLIQNALLVRERKEHEKIANIIGTKPESIRQGIVIKNKAKKDSEIAAEWQKALSGKTTIKAVYNKATQMKKPLNKGKKRNTISEINELSEQKNVLTERISNLGQINQLIKGKYDRLVQVLKKILKDVKNNSGNIEKKFEQIIDKLETLIDEINNPQKEILFFPSPEDLRKAELKLN